MTKQSKIRSTTILCIRRDGKVVMAGDGQVTLGSEVLKATAKKLRRLYNGKVVAGFAGATADAFALFARFESKLEQHNGNLAALRGGARQGMADGPHAAPSGSPAAGGRHRQHLHRQRQRRRDRSGQTASPPSVPAELSPSAPPSRCLRTRNFARAKSSKSPWRSPARLCIYTNESVVYEELG